MNAATTGDPTTAQVVAAYLSAAGIDEVFAYPGDPIIEFMDAARANGTQVVLARREGTAAFMAEAAGMVTGRPGACLSTLGPGSTALVNGVAAAYLDRVPMLAISGQIETSREQFFTHQVVDHKLLFSPVTKWAGRIEASAVGTTMRKAIRLACASRPGSVHLTCAGDVFKQRATDSDVRIPPLRPSAAAPSIFGGSADEVLSHLRSSRSPVVLAGIGAVRSEAGDELRTLAETGGLPVVVSPMAKGVMPEDHPLFAGVLDMACNDVLWDLLAGADTVVAVGFDAVELIKPWTVKTPVVHIDDVENSDQIYFAGHELVGDVRGLLRWLAESWPGESRWSERDVTRHRTRLRDAYYAGRERGRLNPTDVVDVVREVAPRDTRVTCDVGSHKLLVGQGWTTHEPRGVLMTNGLSSMGFGVPAAVSSQIVEPDRPAIALVGDGGFAMTATELRLAAARGQNLAVVVFADGSLNRIELKQMAQSLPSTATRIEGMDLVGLAAAMDCDGIRVSTASELEKAMDGVGHLSRPLVVQADIDPSQYESQF
ncbi:MAG: hypothetical protein GEV28_40025 [Actinophytocola sp.]|uniref:thiamine pyrophosphate-binding protein n=1 Tax=Actinophytocola sp. TaxID=1872138 RepID=UPI0013271AC4|nr:thiamine pyrophosphate-binding protein [Actinophytocola sp.]MPZ86230.1 hypothetical protein [Actinophytocola sp.]